jgi:hypothetical protein
LILIRDLTKTDMILGILGYEWRKSDVIIYCNIKFQNITETVQLKERDTAGQDRRGLDRTGQVRSGQVRSGQGRAGQGRAGQGRAG